MEEQEVLVVTEARRGIQRTSCGVHDLLQQSAETQDHSKRAINDRTSSAGSGDDHDTEKNN